MDRYFWCYLVGPLIAAPLAGFIGNMHLNAVVAKNGMSPPTQDAILSGSAVEREDMAKKQNDASAEEPLF